MMSTNSDKSYFMPLNSKDKEGSIGKSIFFTPKVNYSKETTDFIKLLMEECHLTNKQKTSFESILRSGDSLPSKSDQVNFKERIMKRRLKAAEELGIKLKDSSSSSFSSGKNERANRRSYEAIKASGALDLNLYSDVKVKYIPKNQEMEKIRLAHKMAFGKNLPEISLELISKKLGVIRENNNSILERKKERVAELIVQIEERIEFLKVMKTNQKEKIYKQYISGQIKEKLAEIRRLTPSGEEYENIIKQFKLENNN